MSKIIIAFDGPDNVGKSTQIGLLRKHFSQTPFLILNVDAPVGSNASEKLAYGKAHIQKTFEAMDTLSSSQIHDRSHFTEYAYSFFRDGHDIEDILALEKTYEHLKDNLCIITFIDEVENIISRDDGASAYDKENTDDVLRIVENFKEISKRSLFPNIIINIHGKDIPTVQAEVNDYIAQQFPDFKR